MRLIVTVCNHLSYVAPVNYSTFYDSRPSAVESIGSDESEHVAHGVDENVATTCMDSFNLDTKKWPTVDFEKDISFNFTREEIFDGNDMT